MQRITVNDQSQGLNPLWVLQNGAPAWAQVPNINPSVGNGSNVPYYNGKSASTPSDEMTYAFNIERQVDGQLGVGGRLRGYARRRHPVQFAGV